MAVRRWFERGRRGAPCLSALALAALLAAPADGLENDPYTGRPVDLSDSLAVLDRRMNDVLDDIAVSWRSGRDERAFVDAVYRRMGSVHWIDKLERWAMNSPDVDRLAVPLGETMFAAFPLSAARLSKLVPPAPLIRVHGTLMGTDKIGHFISQGRKYYRRYRTWGRDGMATHGSAAAEAVFFGGMLAGIYSNADMVANYEGYRFYRGLFHADAVEGRGAIFRWRGERPVRQRVFSWADHVNPLWDEAFNPSVYAAPLLPVVEARLLGLCEDFALRPERYRVDYDPLLARYANAGVRFNDALVPKVFLAERCPKRAAD